MFTMLCLIHLIGRNVFVLKKIKLECLLHGETICRFKGLFEFHCYISRTEKKEQNLRSELMCTHVIY